MDYTEANGYNTLLQLEGFSEAVNHHTCGTCGRLRGKPCVNVNSVPTGRLIVIKRPHVSRLESAYPLDREAIEANAEASAAEANANAPELAVACTNPRCRAEPNRPCKSVAAGFDSLPMKSTHIERKLAWAQQQALEAGVKSPVVYVESDWQRRRIIDGSHCEQCGAAREMKCRGTDGLPMLFLHQVRVDAHNKANEKPKRTMRDEKIDAVLSVFQGMRNLTGMSEKDLLRSIAGTLLDHGIVRVRSDGTVTMNAKAEEAY